MQILTRVPDEVTSKFYGCGAPLPLGIDGLHVLDLGSGSGRDCYVCSALVGPHGSVTGVDMTDEQNEVSVGIATGDLHMPQSWCSLDVQPELAVNTMDTTMCQYYGSKASRDIAGCAAECRGVQQAARPREQQHALRDRPHRVPG